MFERKEREIEQYWMFEREREQRDKEKANNSNTLTNKIDRTLAGFALNVVYFPSH